MARSQQDDVAQLVGEERETAQNERPHDDLAQLSVSRNQGAQALRAKLKKFSCLADASQHETSLPRDHAQLAREPRGMVRGDEALTLQAGLHNFQAPGKQDEEREAGVARTEEHLAPLHVSHFAAGTDSFDLFRRQRGEHLFTGIERAWDRPGGHGLKTCKGRF